MPDAAPTIPHQLVDVSTSSLLEERCAGVLFPSTPGPLTVLRNEAVAAFALSARLPIVAAAYRTGIGASEPLFRLYSGGRATHTMRPVGLSGIMTQEPPRRRGWVAGLLAAGPFSCFRVTSRPPGVPAPAVHRSRGTP